MDALDLLISDHNRVKELFEQIQTERGLQQKRLLFENIRIDLETHAYIEENVFYPEFRRKPGFVELIGTSYAEHGLMKTALRELDEMNVDHPRFDEKFGELMNDVLAHVKKEEGTLFPLVRKAMSRHDREHLARHLSSAKQEKQEEAA